MTSPYQLNHYAQTAPPARILPDDLVPELNGVTCWLSNIKRDGEWVLPRVFRAFTFMGNIELDLTSALMGQGVSEVDIRCIMANVEITVPPHVSVVCDGEGFMGNFEVVRTGETLLPPPGAQTLKVSGNAYLGSVKVKIVGPAKPGWVEKLKSGWQSLNSD